MNFIFYLISSQNHGCQAHYINNLFVLIYFVGRLNIILKTWQTHALRISEVIVLEEGSLQLQKE